MIEPTSFDRDKTPIDDIAPHPKRPRIDQTQHSEGVDQHVLTSEEIADEPFDDEDSGLDDIEPADEFMDDISPRSHLTEKENVSFENVTSEENHEGGARNPHIPNSRVKAFLNSAFPQLQIGKQSLELIKEVALAITMDFVAGTIQEKVWTIDDPRYLEKAHMRLTREDGLKFLEMHSHENPWGLFAHTQNWQGLQWRGDLTSIEDVGKPQRSKEKVDARQPLITNFFTRGD